MWMEHLRNGNPHIVGHTMTQMEYNHFDNEFTTN